jgi:tripartite-type tricarboxylate transporter receptor subunit TctC
LASPELQKKLEDNGAVVMRGTAADFGAFMTKDHARWGDVIRKAGITTNSP